jgi:hypothetical protein
VWRVGGGVHISLWVLPSSFRRPLHPAMLQTPILVVVCSYKLQWLRVADGWAGSANPCVVGHVGLHGRSDPGIIPKAILDEAKESTKRVERSVVHPYVVT